MARVYASMEQERDESLSGVKWPLHRLSRHGNYEEAKELAEKLKRVGLSVQRGRVRKTQKEHGGLYKK